MKIVKYPFLFLLVAFSLYVLSIIVVLNARHFKVIDPSDPKFKPENFRVADYFNNKEMTFARAKEVLLLGKKREFIEYILVEVNNAEVRDEQIFLSECPSEQAVTRVYYSLTPWWALAMSIYHLNLGGYSYGATVCYDKNKIAVNLF